MKKSLIALSCILCFSLAHADSREEARALRKEAYKLERQMSELIPKIDDRDPELKALRDASAKASSEFTKAVEKHPALESLRAKQKEVFSALTMAISKGDAEGKKAAQDAYAKAYQELYATGRELPDIKPLSDAAIAAGATYTAKREEVYASQPETAALAKQAAELRAKAAQLRQSK